MVRLGKLRRQIDTMASCPNGKLMNLPANKDAS
jgi:hypothetical protein